MQRVASSSSNSGSSASTAGMRAWQEAQSQQAGPAAPSMQHEGYQAQGGMDAALLHSLQSRLVRQSRPEDQEQSWPQQPGAHGNGPGRERQSAAHASPSQQASSAGATLQYVLLFWNDNLLMRYPAHCGTAVKLTLPCARVLLLQEESFPHDKAGMQRGVS